MGFLNNVLNGLFTGLLWPFQSLPPAVAVTVMALLTAMGMLVVFKKTSDQERIARVKGRIQASIFEIRLFNDDMGAILRSQGRILRDNLAYAGLSLVPALWMIIPFVLIVAQLQSHYGWTGLQPDAPVLLKVQLDPDWLDATASQSTNGPKKPEIVLDLPAGLKQETPPVWIPSNGEMVWRIRPQESGRHEVALALAGERASKQVYVSDVPGARAPSRQQPGFLHQLLYPAEAPLSSASPIRSISVDYPARSLALPLGLRLHWLILYLVLSIAFAFALRNRFGVTI